MELELQLTAVACNRGRRGSSPEGRPLSKKKGPCPLGGVLVFAAKCTPFGVKVTLLFTKHRKCVNSELKSGQFTESYTSLLRKDPHKLLDDTSLLVALERLGPSMHVRSASMLCHLHVTLV